MTDFGVASMRATLTCARCASPWPVPGRACRELGGRSDVRTHL